MIFTIWMKLNICLYMLIRPHYPFTRDDIPIISYIFSARGKTVSSTRSVLPEVFYHENCPQPLDHPQEPLPPPGPPLHLFSGLSLSSSVRPDPWVPEFHEDEARGRKTRGRAGPCKDVNQQGKGHPQDDASQGFPQTGTLLKNNKYGEHQGGDICINGFLRT